MKKITVGQKDRHSRWNVDLPNTMIECNKNDQVKVNSQNVNSSIFNKSKVLIRTLNVVLTDYWVQMEDVIPENPLE